MTTLATPRLGGQAPVATRLPSLTGLRFIAALMVFFFHAQYIGLFSAPETALSYHSIFGQGGWSGVGFFFVLSGFVLAWSARPSDTAGRFWRRRFFKVYPNHVVTFLAALILLTTVANQVVATGPALLNLFLLQAWFSPIEINNTVNTVSWSLSCEALFYLSFPLLWKLISRIRPERLWASAGVVIAAIVAVPFIAMALPTEAWLPWANASEEQLWFVYFFPPARLLDFVFGIILARIVLSGRSLPLGLGGSAALAVLAYWLAPQLPGTFYLVSATVVPLGLVIAAGAKADLRGAGGWLASKPMVWLGEVSFAFYMVHFLVLTYAHKWISGQPLSTPAALAELVLLFAITLTVAWLLYSLVERPMMRKFSVSRKLKENRHV